MTTTRCSQVVTAASPRNEPARRNAAIIPSCRPSAASSGLPMVRSATAHSRSRCRPNSSPNASGSPSTCGAQQLGVGPVGSPHHVTTTSAIVPAEPALDRRERGQPDDDVPPGDGLVERDGEGAVGGGGRRRRRGRRPRSGASRRGRPATAVGPPSVGRRLADDLGGAEVEDQAHAVLEAAGPEFWLYDDVRHAVAGSPSTPAAPARGSPRAGRPAGRSRSAVTPVKAVAPRSASAGVVGA